jgi:hypothetical protein
LLDEIGNEQSSSKATPDSKLSRTQDEMKENSVDIVIKLGVAHAQFNLRYPNNNCQSALDNWKRYGSTQRRTNNCSTGLTDNLQGFFLQTQRPLINWKRSKLTSYSTIDIQ